MVLRDLLPLGLDCKSKPKFERRQPLTMSDFEVASLSFVSTPSLGRFVSYAALTAPRRMKMIIPEGA